VLLIAFGGPEKPEDIRPFLDIVTSGRRIPESRIADVVRHYELIGGRSPLTELTMRQADALRAALRRLGRREAVYVGMRNWHPFLHETLEAMRTRGHRHALGIILSSLQTEASWERYVADVATVRGRVGAGAPEVSYAPPWGDHPLFLDTMVARAADALAEVAQAERDHALLVVTAHSVPVAMAQGSPYTHQLHAAAQAVAARLGHRRWQVAYQSRSGAPSDPWLEPDICAVLQSLEGTETRSVVVLPIGFVCDHVEVLYDLDVEARAVASQIGVSFHRAQAANDHPSFIAMLADLVERGPR
jgi:protoporphyrin/coproporphyrin ferrochelatase